VAYNKGATKDKGKRKTKTKADDSAKKYETRIVAKKLTVATPKQDSLKSQEEEQWPLSFRVCP